jgi:hypothetical protein
MSILLIESMHMMFDCIEEIDLLGLEGGCCGSEYFSISMLPNVPSNILKKLHEEVIVDNHFLPS